MWDLGSAATYDVGRSRFRASGPRFRRISYAPLERALLSPERGSRAPSKEQRPQKRPSASPPLAERRCPRYAVRLPSRREIVPPSTLFVTLSFDGARHLRRSRHWVHFLQLIGQKRPSNRRIRTQQGRTHDLPALLPANGCYNSIERPPKPPSNRVVTPTRYSPLVSSFPCVEITAGQEGYEKRSRRRGRMVGTNLVRIASRFVPAPVLR